MIVISTRFHLMPGRLNVPYKSSASAACGPRSNGRCLTAPAPVAIIVDVCDVLASPCGDRQSSKFFC
jgi:hypothetical protein